MAATGGAPTLPDDDVLETMNKTQLKTLFNSIQPPLAASENKPYLIDTLKAHRDGLPQLIPSTTVLTGMKKVDLQRLCTTHNIDHADLATNRDLCNALDAERERQETEADADAQNDEEARLALRQTQLTLLNAPTLTVNGTQYHHLLVDGGPHSLWRAYALATSPHGESSWRTVRARLQRRFDHIVLHYRDILEDDRESWDLQLSAEEPACPARKYMHEALNFVDEGEQRDYVVLYEWSEEMQQVEMVVDYSVKYLPTLGARTQATNLVYWKDDDYWTVLRPMGGAGRGDSPPPGSGAEKDGPPPPGINDTSAGDDASIEDNVEPKIPRSSPSKPKRRSEAPRDPGPPPKKPRTGSGPGRTFRVPSRTTSGAANDGEELEVHVEPAPDASKAGENAEGTTFTFKISTADATVTQTAGGEKSGFYQEAGEVEGDREEIELELVIERLEEDEEARPEEHPVESAINALLEGAINNEQAELADTLAMSTTRRISVTRDDRGMLSGGFE